VFVYRLFLILESIIIDCTFAVDVMIIDGESEVLSDVEVILPREVMETCQDLQQGGTSCFLSVNKQDCTTSQLFIHKLNDDSIKIRITGTFLYIFNIVYVEHR